MGHPVLFSEVGVFPLILGATFKRCAPTFHGARADRATVQVEGRGGHGVLGAAHSLAAAHVAADVGLAQLGVGFLDVAVDHAVGGEGAAAALTGLSARVVGGVLATDVTPALIGALGYRAQARLGFGVQRLGRCPRGGVDLGVGVAALAGDALGALGALGSDGLG